MPKSRWSGSELFQRGLLAVLLIVLAGRAQAAAVLAPASRLTATLLEESLLEVRLNGVLQETSLAFLRSGSGMLYLSAQNLQRLRLRLPQQAPVQHRGEAYFPLDRIEGLAYRLDEARQEVWIDLPGSAFYATVVDVQRPAKIPQRSAMPGGFMNYDISLQHIQGKSRAGGQVELGMFNSMGAGRLSLLGSDLGQGGRVVRLDTSWMVDQPDRMASWRLGDAISRGGSWGRPARFGGIQWGTNFATQPGFITFPTPMLEGSAALPSTLDVYVNNLRTYHGEIEPGPFSLHNMPVITGSGEMQVVVRDMLGREQVVVQPYYASRQLLRAGLTDYSYEIGLQRNNYGVESNDYGRWLAVATHRHGYSDRFTGELHAELQSGSQALGVAGIYQAGWYGVLDAALAASHSDRGAGGLLALGFERQASFISFGAHTQFTSRDFAQLGLADGMLPPLQQTTLRVSMSGGRLGTLGAGYIRQDNRGTADAELLTANYSLTIMRDWFLNLNAFRSLSGQRDHALGFTLTRALGERTSASFSATESNAADTAQFQLQRSLPVGPGLGYRLLAEEGATDHVFGSVSAQNDVGTYTLEADRFAGQTSYRGFVSGGVALMNGAMFFSRSLGDGFAVVDVPGYADVDIYAENQLVAHTDAAGMALVPRLRPYDRNRISIAHQDLPIDARVGAVELETVPYYGSGTYLRFPVGKESGATFRVTLADGKPVPAGATARLDGSQESFPVGRNGEVYIAGLGRKNRVAFSWLDRQCALDLEYPQTDEPLPDLGTFICTEGGR